MSLVQVHFNLSLGRAFGGTVVAKPIMLWLDPFLRTTLADLIVWPNRIVVPLSYDPDFDYSILEMRCAAAGACRDVERQHGCCVRPVRACRLISCRDDMERKYANVAAVPQR